MSFGADRSVKVNLKASVSDYLGKITAASKATKDFSRDAIDSANKHKDSWNKVGNGMLLTGAVIAAGVGLAIKSFADFDAQMSQVKAVSGATGAEMDRLRAAALQAGKATKYSASEAAVAETELAKVGISTADILSGALTGSLNLAAAGNLELGRAAEISGQAMKIFKLEGKDVGHIADVLANGANKSAADVEQLAQALSQGGLVAAQAGLTLDDTVGTLSAFADNALIGSDAGTSFKNMLLRLNPQTKEARETMEALGLSAYDSQGQFVGITAYAGKLRAALKDTTVEQRNATLQTVFGSDAIRAATILYDEGEQGIRKYVDAVGEQGSAARVAAINMDNLKGDIEQLRGSIETALIQSGSGANDMLRDMVQLVTGAVNAFADLPTGIQGVVLGFGAFSAGALLAVGGVIKLVTAAAAAKKAIEELGLASKLAASATPLGLAFTVAAVAVGLFAKSQLDAKAKADSLRDSLDQQTGAITDNTRVMVAKQLQEAGALKTAQELGLNLETVTNAALGQSGALDELRKSTQFAGGSAVQLVDTQNILGGSMKLGASSSIEAAKSSEAYAAKLQALLGIVTPINTVLGGQTTAQKEVAAAAGTATSGVKDLAQTESELKKSADDAAKAHEDLIRAVQEFGGATIDARAAARDYQAALDDASKSLKENGKTLSTNTAEGRANQAALENIRTTALKSITANAEHGASLATLNKQVDGARAQFVTFATKMGMSKTEANKLASQLGLTRDNVATLASEIKKTPTAHATKMSVETTAAMKQLAAFQARINALRGGDVRITTRYVDIGKNPSSKAGGITKAEGGLLNGPGTGTSDSIPLWGSNGEYVVKAAAVEKYGKNFFDSVNSMRFASGGYVSQSRASSGGSSGAATVRLDPADRALLTAIANRPIELDGKIVASSVSNRMGSDYQGGEW